MEIKGLSDDNILKISHIKEEDEWALKYRIDSYHNFLKLGLPDFGPKIELDFDNIIYYKSRQESEIKNNWNDINCSVKNELDNLGVLESEKHLDGIGVQYESEVIYHNMLSELEEKNVIFTSIEVAMKKYPEDFTVTVIFQDQTLTYSLTDAGFLTKQPTQPDPMGNDGQEGGTP